MLIALYIILGVIGITVLVFVVLHFASRRYSLPCPVWLGWMVELDNPFARKCRAGFIVDHLKLQPGMTVLDAGCGPGRVTLPLAGKVLPGGKVMALDIQEGMLRRTREKAESAGLTNIEYVHAGLGEGKLESETFDRATLVTVLGEIPDREAALREIFDAMKPGGILSVTELIFDPHFQRRGTVVRLATEAGFREKAFFGSRIAYTMHFEKPSGK